MEQFVSTPELHSENSIGTDPLPPGQIWALSPGGPNENPGLFRIEVTEGPGSGVKILNQSPPGQLLVIVGGLNLGGSIEPIYNAVSIVELAADKGAQKVLIPVSARKQLFELPDELATKVIVVYYTDAKDALIKAVSE